MPAKKLRVLFVCIGNACRSPMAEAIANREASDVLEASSAGLYPLGEIPEDTQETLLRNGYSPDGLSSKPITNRVWNNTDLVINLSGRIRDIAFDDPAKVEDWDVDDPYGADPAFYQTIFEQLQQRIRLLADRLRRQRQSQ
ncbi:MAG TPA: low molecular weight phosphatase family protein [Candidatus Acidoferrum sp.]|jgi:arsenate reductase